MARQNKSPRFVLTLRSGSLPLAIATAPEQNLLELLRVNLQKEVYTNRWTIVVAAFAAAALAGWIISDLCTALVRQRASRAIRF